MNHHAAEISYNLILAMTYLKTKITELKYRNKNSNKNVGNRYYFDCRYNHQDILKI